MKTKAIQSSISNCRYVKNKTKLFSMILTLFFLCQLVQNVKFNDDSALKVTNILMHEIPNVNFGKEGKWTVYEMNEFNADNRVAEYNPDAAYFFSEFQDDNLLKQSMIRPFDNVIVYYADRTPIIDRSIRDNHGVVFTDYFNQPDSILEILNQKVQGEESAQLGLLNALPLVDVSNSKYTTNVPQLNRIFRQLEAKLDAPGKDDPNNNGFYLPNPMRFFPKLNDEKSVQLNTILIRSLTKKMLKVAYEQSDKSGDAPTEAQKNEFADKVIKVVGGHKDNLTTAINVIRIMMYFTIKCIRYYFLKSNTFFLNDLFRDYEKGSSTLATLFESLSKTVTARRVIQFDFFDSLTREFIMDVTNNKAENVTDALGDIDMVSEYKKMLLYYFRNVYEFNSKVIKEYVPSAKEDIKHLSNTVIFKLYLETIRDHLFPLFFKVILPQVHESFYGLPCIEAQNIKELRDGNPDDLFELRKYLRILGFVDFNAAIDADQMSYTQLDIFVESGRRLLI